MTESNAVLERLIALEQRIDEGFDGVDARFDGVDARFDGVDARFDGVDARFDGVDARLDGVDARFDGVDARLDGVDEQLGIARGEDRHGPRAARGDLREGIPTLWRFSSITWAPALEEPPARASAAALSRPRPARRCVV